MWNETAEGRKFIEDVSKHLVGRVAPEELEFFDELACAENSPSASLSGDEELGFGLSEAALYVTPAAVSVVTAVFTFVGSEILKATGKEVATAVVGKFKLYFSQPESALSAEQITRVEQIARTAAKENGLDDDTGGKLTASLIASLTKKP
jgi:hypothetical protein